MLKSTPRIIFVTAYIEHAVEAFDLDATDCLVKPVTFERLLKAVQKTGTWGHNEASASLPQERDTK
jgi:two-component SAPR family response regulator